MQQLVGLQNQRTDARKRLREAVLRARRPHKGLNLAAVRGRDPFEWANAHLRWRLEQMADSTYSIVWASCLLMLVLELLLHLKKNGSKNHLYFMK